MFIVASDPDFQQGVRNLAKILDIPLHEDDKITLEAVKILVEERLADGKETSAKSEKVRCFIRKLGIFLCNTEYHTKYIFYRK